MSDEPLAWFASPNINSKWHKTARVADDKRGVQIYMAPCGTMVAATATHPVPTRDVPPSRHDICRKCLRRRAS